jgi:predicted aspartyl protease
MQISFEWVKRKTDHYGHRYLPICSAWVRLNEHGQWRNVNFRVDSGAIVTAMNFAEAEVMGITKEQWDKAERVDLSTATGQKIWGRKLKVSIDLEGIGLNNVEAFFSEKNELTTALLGLIDVFDYFDVNLQARKRRTVLTH